jgi:O-antigen/teichoic acid export membrane protein
MILAYRSDLLMVNHYLGLAAAGVYSVALSLSEILRGVAETAQILVLSRAADRQLRTHAAALARQAMLAAVIAGLAMALAADVLVPVVFGEAYREASRAFWFLVPGIVGLTGSYALSPLLFLEGRVLLNGVAAVCGLGTLWLVGTQGPGAPSLVKFASVSSLAYWVLAFVQIGYLRARGDVRFRALVPSWQDGVALAKEVGWFVRRLSRFVQSRPVSS